jgi:hypothetical protein
LPNNSTCQLRSSVLSLHHGPSLCGASMLSDCFVPPPVATNISWLPSTSSPSGLKSDLLRKFIRDIMHRFGVPNRIITDLGAASAGSVFWDFCQDNTIDVYYSSVAHPWCNGQVERANGMVLQALKDRTTRWLAELPHVIWGLRTQVSSAMGFSPLFLVYGSEVVLPTDIAFRAPWI